jgi:hypothetical protein
MIIIKILFIAELIIKGQNKYFVESRLMLENIFFIKMILNILVQLIINYTQKNYLQCVFLLVQKYLFILLFIKIILRRPDIS